MRICDTTRIIHDHTADKLKDKNLLIPAAAGSPPSMRPLVFWPRAGAFGAGAILELCAQLVWRELYDMKD